MKNSKCNDNKKSMTGVYVCVCACVCEAKRQNDKASNRQCVKQRKKFFTL